MLLSHSLVPPGSTVRPERALDNSSPKVYEGAACYSEVLLADLQLSAALSGPPSNAETRVDGVIAYTFTVGKLPPVQTVLCCTCAMPSKAPTVNGKEHPRRASFGTTDCRVKISVPPEPSSSTPAPPASSSPAPLTPASSSSVPFSICLSSSALPKHGVSTGFAQHTLSWLEERTGRVAFKERSLKSHGQLSSVKAAPRRKDTYQNRCGC